jgi:predicted nucleotide-binding protein
LAVAEAIQFGLHDSAECTIWHQEVFQLGATTIETIVETSAKFDFAVMVFTPDDTMIQRGKKTKGPRDNLLFELGLFTGILGRARTILVHPRDAGLTLPSDLAGVTAATYTMHSDGNLQAALGPVCTRIKRVMGVV